MRRLNDQWVRRMYELQSLTKSWLATVNQERMPAKEDYSVRRKLKDKSATYNIKHTTPKATHFSYYPPSFDINYTDDHVITASSQQPTITV